ncbi:MAG: PD-(D/E)XK nuclease family protein, partial [Deinococcales bacterium]
ERAPRGQLLAHLRACWAAFGLSAPVRPGQGPPAGPDAGAAAGGRRAGGALASDAPSLSADTLPPADALAFQRLTAAAVGLGLPARQPSSLGAFLHDLDALLTLVSVPVGYEPVLGVHGDDPDGNGAVPGRVELHTPLAVYGARYRHVFVLGAAEGVLPKPVADDPVLDFAERRDASARGLPLEGAVEAAQREALSFRAVLWTLDGEPPGASLTLSYPEDVGIASPYFAGLGLEPSAPGPKPPASAEELRRQRILAAPAAAGEADPVLAAAREAWAVERRREEAGGPDAHDGLIGEAYGLGEHVFSATQLLDLGQCPFRWLARVPFKLAEPEEAEDDVSPLLRGRLYHVALERALRRGRDAAGGGDGAGALRDAALDALGDAFAEAEEAVNAAAVPAWPLRRGQHLEQLRRVLSAESFLPDGAEVIALEQRFPEGRETPPRWRGFFVRGVVDRVDRRSGALVLVDYKTGSRRPAGAQDENGKARLDLQLPLYLEAAAPALFADERVAGAQYYSLTKADVIAEVRLDRELAGELDAFAARVRALLETGAYPVAPDLDFEACRFCDFDLVCRKGPRTERMRSRGALTVPAPAAASGRDEGEP